MGAMSTEGREVQSTIDSSFGSRDEVVYPLQVLVHLCLAKSVSKGEVGASRQQLVNLLPANLLLYAGVAAVGGHFEHYKRSYLMRQ